MDWQFYPHPQTTLLENLILATHASIRMLSMVARPGKDGLSMVARPGQDGIYSTSCGCMLSSKAVDDNQGFVFNAVRHTSSLTLLATSSDRNIDQYNSKCLTEWPCRLVRIQWAGRIQRTVLITILAE